MIAVAKQLAPAAGEPRLWPPAFPASVDSYLSWSVQTLDGRHANLADFQEKSLFVDIRAAQCGTCVWEMPAIERLAERFAGEDVAFLVVSDEPLDAVCPFVAEKEKKAGSCPSMPRRRSR